MTPLMRRGILLLLLIAILLPRVERAQGDAATALPAFRAVDAGLPAVVHDGTAARIDALPATRPIRMAIALAGRDEAGLGRLLAAIADHRSPQFHRYLSAGQFAARFGPDPAAVRALSRWLTGQGLRPERWVGGSVLDVSGDVAEVQRALGIRLSRYRLPGGVRFAPDREPLLPAALAPAVSSIVGLSQAAPAFSRTPRLTALTRGALPDRLPGQGAAPTGAAFSGGQHGVAVGGTVPGGAHGVARAASRAETGPGGGYDPSDIDAAYDFAPIRAAGMHGEHMRAALVELGSYQPSDVNAYAAQYGITPQIANYTIDGGNGSTSDNVEAALDIELLLANAPSAAIDVYNAPNDGTGTGLVDAYSAVAKANNAQVLSLEWVNCEAAAMQLTGFVGAEHRIFQQLAAQGTTVVSATGDAGAYGCADQVASTDPLANTVGVNLPASDPYVTAVGATDLSFTSQGGAAAATAESGWSCAPSVSSLCAGTSPHGAGSGGGVSSIFHAGDSYGTSLSWQSGVGVSNQASTGFRQVPDVSISGSYGSAGHEYSIYFQGKWERGGGTSAAAPEWAALILRIDQDLIQQGLKPLGWANPILYQIANGAQPYPAFHDVQTGNNLVYNATAGWDYATGLGSPDGWNLLRNVVAASQAASANGGSSTGGSPSPSSSPTAIPTSAAASRTPTASPSQPPTGGGGAGPTLTPQLGTSPTPTATLGYPNVAFGTNPPSATGTSTAIATATSTVAASGQVLAFPTARPSVTATTKPTATAPPEPSAARPATSVTTSTVRPTATPSPTPKPAARTKPAAAPALPQPEPATSQSPPEPVGRTAGVPGCAATGVANGSFLTGTLACWQGGGAPAPVVRRSTRLAHRFSVLLRSAASGHAGSVLSQRFTVPSWPAKPMLSISYWLDTSGGKAAHLAPVRPILTVVDARGRVLQRATIAPHREYTWASFKMALPSGARRIGMSIAIPSQPRGVELLLAIDSISLGS